MAKEKKPQVKVTPKKAIKYYYSYCSLACGAMPFFSMKNRQVKETVDVSAVSDSLVSEEIMLIQQW